MCFSKRLKEFIQDYCFDTTDYEYTVRVVMAFLQGQRNIEWKNLTLHMQQIIIDFEKETGIKGLVPEGAQLNHCYIL